MNTYKSIFSSPTEAAIFSIRHERELSVRMLEIIDNTTKYMIECHEYNPKECIKSECLKVRELFFPISKFFDDLEEKYGSFDE